MGWESRNGFGRFYTRSRKVNGRIVREYVGSGPLADLAYQQDVADRAKREAQRNAFGEIRRRDAELDAELDSFSDLVDAVAFGLLIASGHHQHKRGQWRKQRVQNNTG